jgi:hypothetical protein
MALGVDMRMDGAASVVEDAEAASRLGRLGSERELLLKVVGTPRVGRDEELEDGEEPRERPGMLGLEYDMALLDGAERLERLGLEKELWMVMDGSGRGAFEGGGDRRHGISHAATRVLGILPVLGILGAQ